MEHWVLSQAQSGRPMAGRSLAVVCCGMEVLGQAEVLPSRVQVCTIEVRSEGLLAWGLGLLKAPARDTLEQVEVGLARDWKCLACLTVMVLMLCH